MQPDGSPTAAEASELEMEVERAATAPVSSEEAQAARRALVAEHGSNLVGLIFYGSRLNRTAGPRSDWDFFAIVQDYARAHSSRVHALLNRVLPPSIYRREITLEDGSVARGKLSFLSLDDLLRYTSPVAPDSYVLGRLSKRVALLHWRDPEARRTLVAALARSVSACADWVLREVSECASIEALARRAVEFSYRCEERVEGPARARELFEADAAHFAAVYGAAIQLAARRGDVRVDPADGRVVRIDDGGGAPAASAERFRRRSRRRARLRWLKNVLTFEGWYDYLIAKLERHQGLRIELGPRERRHPLLSAARHYLRLRRQGRLSRHGGSAA